MFKFLSRGDYHFKSELGLEGVLSSLFFGEKKISIDKVDKTSKIYEDIKIIERIMSSLHNVDLAMFHKSTNGIFEKLNVPSNLCFYENGAILISYPLLYACKFENFLELLCLKNNVLDFLCLPEFNFLNLKIKFLSKIDSRNFKIGMSILNELNQEISDFEIKGLTLTTILGEHYFITPEQKALIEFVTNFNSKNQTTMNERVGALSNIKKLAEKCAVNLSDSIRNRSYINIEELKVTMARTLDGNILIEPDISPDIEVNKYFRNNYGKVDDLSKQTLRTFDSKGNEVYISFDENVEKDRKKIDEIRGASIEEKDQVLQNPENYFRESQLTGFILENVLSDRITGFLFGKPDSDGNSLEKKNSIWNSGYEGESLFLQSKDGYSVVVDLSTIPEFYPEIVRKIEETKKKLTDIELIQRLEDNDFLTPIPIFNNELIKLSSISGEYTLDSLIQLSKRIESHHRPELSNEDLDEAINVLSSSKTTDLIIWENSYIPHNSLKKAVGKIQNEVKKKEKIESVSFALDPLDGVLEVKGFENKINHARPPFLIDKFNLKNHQIYGYNWLINLWNKSFGPIRKGALLADDMGLGKTLQVISLISYVKSLQDFSAKPVLIVAPLSLIDGSWIEEGFHFFFEDRHISQKINSKFKIINLKDIKLSYPKIEIYREAQSLHNKMIEENKKFSELQLSSELSGYLQTFRDAVSNNILVSSYETLRSKMFELSFLDFSLVVLDEAQKIKSESSQQNRAAKSLNSDMNIAMTGTPIENGLMDLWNVMDFVCPMKLGSKKDFKFEFVSQIKNCAPGTDDRKLLKEALEKKLNPFWLRRIKSDVLIGDEALPPITYFDSIEKNNELLNIHACQMSIKQQELYKQKMSIYNSTSGGDRLAIIRQLLEVCCAPWIPYEEKISYENFQNLFELCPKLRITFEILDQIFLNSEEQGRKVVIFANIIQIQKSLAYMIKEWAKYKYNLILQVEVYNGETTDPFRRKDILKNFNEAQGFKALIISPKAGGAGLNIQEANHVIHYTREWNPALENQATARCYRIGQKRPVSVYFPTTIGNSDNRTAEEKLANILRDKRSVMDDFTISSSEFDISVDAFVDKNDDVADFKISFDDLISIGHKNFERFVAKIFEKLGYMATVVGGAFDAGADIVCIGKTNNLLIQVKQKQSSNSSALNTGPINEIRGAKAPYEYKHNKEFQLVVVTNGKFSSLAYQSVAQAGNDVALYDGGWIEKNLEKITINFSEIR